MAESAGQGPGQEDEPQVHAVAEGDVVSVTVEGELKQSGTFEATSVLTKCPSKYEMRRG